MGPDFLSKTSNVVFLLTLQIIAPTTAQGLMRNAPPKKPLARKESQQIDSSFRLNAPPGKISRPRNFHIEEHPPSEIILFRRLTKVQKISFHSFMIKAPVQ